MIPAGAGSADINDTAYSISDSISPWNGPVIGLLDQSSTHWILFHVVPFLAVALARAQYVIEEFFLPDRPPLPSARARFVYWSIFPFLHEHWQRFSRQFRPAKEMHMIRHDDIAPNRPAVAIMRVAPFIAHYGCNFICRQDRSSSERAGGDEINGLIDPDAFKSTQMFMHSIVCSRHRRCRLAQIDKSNRLPDRDHRSRLQRPPQFSIGR
jgi:hypothetical protein